MAETKFEEHPALLVMDVQRGLVERYGNPPELLERLGAAIAAARAAAIPVIYVIIRFREGYPEISRRSRASAAGRLAGAALSEGNPATDIHPAIAPRPGEVVVTKRRVGAFAGSDLELILRAQGIDSLVLSGLATGGVVLSTVRYAADLDYQLTVLADGCADSEPEVHRVLIEKVFPRQATVLTVAEWQAALAAR